jgi:hypothetical protein
MADTFYQQGIKTENNNIRLGSVFKDPPVTVVDKINQHNHFKLSFYDPSDLLVNDIHGKPAHLAFHADTIQKTNDKN